MIDFRIFCRDFLDKKSVNYYHPQIYVKYMPGMYEHAYMFHHVLSPIRFCDFTLRVSRDLKFTPMEKLAKPFDLPIWITLIATILAVFSIIFVIDMMLSKVVRNFVFGRNVKNPHLAFVQIFFGIGLVITPGRNFARFLFMMFTILWLIIRTAYQAKMFDFLQYDIKQPIANNIQEVIEKQIPVSVEENFIVNHNNEFIKSA